MMKKLQLLVLAIFILISTTSYSQLLPDRKSLSLRKEQRININKYLPTVIEVQDAQGNVKNNQTKQYDSEGNEIFSSIKYDNSETKEYRKWDKLSNGKTVNTYRQIDEITTVDGRSRLQSGKKDYYYSLTEGTLIGEKTVAGECYLDEKTEPTDWTVYEDWTTKRNESQIRIGIEGKSFYSNARFDASGRVTSIMAMIEEDGNPVTVSGTYNWSQDKALTMYFTHQDIKEGVNSVVNFTKFEIVRNKEMFDSYMLLPHLQLFVGSELHSRRIYFNAEGTLKVNKDSPVDIVIESKIDEGQGVYELKTYGLDGKKKVLYTTDLFKKTDANGSYEWSITELERGKTDIATFYSETATYNQYGSLEQILIKEEDYKEKSYVYSRKNVTYDNVGRPLECKIYSGNSLSNLKLEEVEVYKEWVNPATNISNSTQQDPINVYVNKGTLFVGSSARINNVDIYKIDGTLSNQITDTDIPFQLSKGIYIVKVNTDKGVQTRKIVNPGL